MSGIEDSLEKHDGGSDAPLPPAMKVLNLCDRLVDAFYKEDGDAGFVQQQMLELVRKFGYGALYSLNLELLRALPDNSPDGRPSGVIDALTVLNRILRELAFPGSQGFVECSTSRRDDPLPPAHVARTGVADALATESVGGGLPTTDQREESL